MDSDCNWLRGRFNLDLALYPGPQSSHKSVNYPMAGRDKGYGLFAGSWRSVYALSGLNLTISSGSSVRPAKSATIIEKPVSNPK